MPGRMGPAGRGGARRRTRRRTTRRMSAAQGSQEPQQDAPAEESTSEDAMLQLKQLGELHDSGVLTDEEFESKKAELLKDI